MATYSGELRLKTAGDGDAVELTEGVERIVAQSGAREGAVTDVIMERMEVPVIGIGAGASTDGQVLVLHDLLGINDGFKPKFVKRFAAVREHMLRGVEAYAEEVRTRRFPAPEHTYGIAPEELERLRAQLPPPRLGARS